MKRKIVTRALATLLVFSALFSFTGCGGLMFAIDGSMNPYIPQAEYEEGDFSYMDGPLAAGVRCDKNEFNIDEVYLDLYVGFFDKEDGAPTEFRYPNTDLRECYLLYLSNSVSRNVFFEDETKKNLYNLEGRTLVKEFTNEDTLTYGCLEKPFVGVVYDHKETLHIAKELFAEENDVKQIYIELLRFSSTDGKLWETSGIRCVITLNYTKIDENTVRIRF